MNAEFVKEGWYVVAWDHEVRRLELLRRVVLGEPVVLYRTSDGSAVRTVTRTSAASENNWFSVYSCRRLSPPPGAGE